MDILVDFRHVGTIVFLSFSGGAGLLLALTSPRAFAAVSLYGNRTVFGGIQTRFDKRRFDVDTFVHSHARLFGLLVIATVGYVWLISRYGPGAYSKSLLLAVVALGLTMGTCTVIYIVRQSLEIEAYRAEAQTDALTGLANRRAFDKEFARRLAQRQHQGTPLCLLIIDIDNFKSFNDEFGHPLGDAILKEFAKVLEAAARHADTVARLSGDEFAVLLPGSDLEAASQGAERLRSAIGDSPLKLKCHQYTLTVSIGLAEAQPDDDPASLLKRADSALYVAKEAGRNCSFRQGGPEPAVPAACKCPGGRPANGAAPEDDEVPGQAPIEEVSVELPSTDPS